MRLLVPVDFSPCSDVAVDRAIGLAERLGGRIELVHAWSPLYDFGAILSQVSLNRDGERMTVPELLRGESQQQLDALHQRVALRYGDVVANLVDGDAREAIASLAEPERCDLVVMATHGRTGLAHLLLGSVAEWVVRHAQVPVMTVRAATA